MSRINFVPLIKQEGLQNAIIRNKKEPSPLIGYAKRIETYDDIVSLPSNAEGQISVTLRGLTAFNLVQNGNFANGTNYWTADNITNLTVSNGIVQFTATAQNGRLKQNVYMIQGHKYYITALVKADSNQVYIDVAGIGAVYHSGSNSFERLANVFVWTSSTGNIWPFGIRDKRTSNWTPIQATNCFIIDLTAHGLENLSIAELNTMFPYYIDYGTKSTLSGKITTKDSAGNVKSTAYLPNVVLRSLPNGTKDEFSAVEGKHIQRVGVKQNVPSGTVINYADMATGGQFVAYAADGTMQVGVKGDTLTITAVMLLYQLATPIVTQADVYGDLKAFPGGTIYFEPTLWGLVNFDYGQNSKTITTPDVPIGSIRKVIRYDVTDDGRLVETDVTADCTHNGTTLTINNAEPKKTYFYDCEIAPGYSTSAEKIIDVGANEGVAIHDYGAAAADWVLSTNEALATMLVCKNAGGTAKIIAPPAEGKMYIIRNESGQTITIKTASSTGVTVANGKTATVVFYNTDFIKIGEV